MKETTLPTPEQILALIKAITREDFFETLSLWDGYSDPLKEADIKCPWGDPKDEDSKQAILKSNILKMESPMLLAITSSMAKAGREMLTSSEKDFKDIIDEETDDATARVNIPKMMNTIQWNNYKGMLTMLTLIYRASLNRWYEEAEKDK